MTRVGVFCQAQGPTFGVEGNIDDCSDRGSLESGSFPGKVQITERRVAPVQEHGDGQVQEQDCGGLSEQPCSVAGAIEQYPNDCEGGQEPVARVACALKDLPAICVWWFVLLGCFLCGGF